MAGRKHAYRFFAPSIDTVSTGDEFEESDVWGGYQIEPRSANPDPVRSKPIRSSRFSRKQQRPEKTDRATATASMPVSIPDWSKILKDEYNGCGGGGGSFFDSEEDEESGVTGPVIPPHELLWRNRGASFSVHEGIGRTLKGRDLSRVRNAIFQKTGFED